MLLNLKEGEYLGQGLKFRDGQFFTLSMTTYEPYDDIKEHYHDNSYISILTRGTYYEKNKKSGTGVIKPGDILFRPGSYVHENNFENEGGTCFNIEFKPAWDRYFDMRFELPARFTHYKAGHFPSLYKLLINFQHDYNEDMAVELLADYISQINGYPVHKKFQPWVEKIISILENELDRFHSLQALSERVFVHPVYIARGFKERTGLTIGEYQLKAKLSNAVSLLLKTNLAISSISCRNGFFDDAHFIRAFKSVYNISPHRFRLLAKKLS